MSDTPQGPGWWQASDDKWYPPPRPDMLGEAAPPGSYPSEPPTAPVGPGGPPLGSGPGIPGAAPSPYGGIPPMGGQPQQNRTPLFIALGGLGAALLVVLIIVLASGGDDDPETTDGPPTSEIDSPGTTDEVAELPEVTPEEEENTTTGAPSGSVTLEVSEEVVTQYFDDLADGNMSSYAFYLTNPSEQVAENVQVNVSLKDDAGTIVGTDTISIYAIGPGQKFGVANNNLPGGATSVEVQPSTVSDFGNADTFGEITSSNIAVGYDDYGMATFTFDAASTFDEQVESPTVYVLLRDANGNLVGGFNDYTSVFIPPGGSSAFSVDSLWAVPENDANRAEIFFDPGYF